MSRCLRTIMARKCHNLLVMLACLTIINFWDSSQVEDRIDG
jgi:hypothetical protein